MYLLCTYIVTILYTSFGGNWQLAYMNLSNSCEVRVHISPFGGVQETPNRPGGSPCGLGG
jgi:hypothetical protein